MGGWTFHPCQIIWFPHWLGSGLIFNKSKLQISDSHETPVPFKIRNSKGEFFFITVEHPTVFILNAADVFRKITYFLS